MSYSDINKFDAYRTVAKNLNEAENILNSRKLAYGEPAVIQYKEDDGNQSLLVAVGGLNGVQHKLVIDSDIHKTPYENIERITDYLYNIKYDDYSYDYIHQYFIDSSIDSSITASGCSAVRSGNWYGRNYDWYYNNDVEFIIKTTSRNNRHSSIGVAGTISGLTKDFVDSRAYSDRYKLVPFFTLDGINDAGVFCNVNVVPSDYPYNITLDPSKDDQICSVIVPRFVLDNFSSAAEAVDYLKNDVEIYIPKKLHDMGFCVHYMIGDDSSTYVVELVNNKVEVFENQKIMTNFNIYGTTFNDNGTVYTNADITATPSHSPAENGITTYGVGLERYNRLVNSVISDKASMRTALNGVLYSDAYKNTTIPFWYSEFVGGDITTTTPVNSVLFTDEIEKQQGYFARRDLDRDNPKTWFTVHSTIYDLSNKKIYVVSQEKTDNEIEVDFKGNILN